MKIIARLLKVKKTIRMTPIIVVRTVRTLLISTASAIKEYSKVVEYLCYQV